ncbi:flagellar basal body-associated FliL family protein [Treponema parvum]|uniref:flagellar basal body-associated FliL family protein n=1 Tax=Treponema parvum TaxID=138851 RepID=UPI001AEBF7F7|nr:flagellar basal body-associated FliL family protein [Treponema parvum]QTQ15685.1 flagellar basal body-associated FliL family protein [Treponema parvum]
MQISLNKILALISVAIAGAIIIITALSFASGKASPGQDMRKADPAPESVAKEYAAFTELGRLRSFSKPQSGKDRGSPVIITPWISYPAGDRIFYEELIQKARKIRSVITDYFSKYTKEELLAMGEKEIKTELERRINAELVLGKIKAVYFSEYIFLD